MYRRFGKICLLQNYSSARKSQNECTALKVEAGNSPGHYSSLTAPNLQPTANQEQNDQCGNQHYSRELLMMGIVVPETC